MQQVHAGDHFLYSHYKSKYAFWNESLVPVQCTFPDARDKKTSFFFNSTRENDSLR